MSYDDLVPKKKRRPLEDPAALDAARQKMLAERGDEIRRAMSVGPGGQKRQIARLFAKRVKGFKKLMRRAQRRGPQ